MQDYLIDVHGFRPLTLKRTASTPSIEKSAADVTLPGPPQRSNALTFTTVSDIVDYVTQNWQGNYVTTSIHTPDLITALFHRPFAILIHIDAPISLRWQRFKSRCATASLAPPTLEQFVLRNDSNLYSPTTGLATLASRAQIKLLNNTACLQTLHKSLHALNLTDPTRLRPSWDHYFMTLASLAARRSNCMRRQVGCVLVRSSRVISTGYNGTPRHITNCNEGGCARCNTGGGGGASLATCLCIHAEENALLEAGRDRIGGGAVLYCNTCPCLTCSIKIVQVGITEVVYSQSYYMDAQAAELFQRAGVKFRQFSPPLEGLVDLSCGVGMAEGRFEGGSDGLQNSSKSYVGDLGGVHENGHTNANGHAE